jgi:hypothetical protein
MGGTAISAGCDAGAEAGSEVHQLLTRASTAWNSPGEQAGALRALAEARAVFSSRAVP